jgi:putative AlgH/UPF0301 family transcriptional regulator
MNIAACATRSLAILMFMLGCAAGAAAAADVSEPTTLVATPSLGGSPLRESVLFAAPLSNGMHIGFIVNRPSDVALAKAFPEHAASRKVVDPLYFGGPMLPETVFAVVRTPPADAEDVLELMPGLALVMDAQTVDRIIETTPNDARYFAGLIVWAPGELAEEVRAGAWEVSPADTSIVFSAHPEMLWKTRSRGGVGLEARAQSGRVPG